MRTFWGTWLRIEGPPALITRFIRDCGGGELLRQGPCGSLYFRECYFKDTVELTAAQNWIVNEMNLTRMPGPFDSDQGTQK